MTSPDTSCLAFGAEFPILYSGDSALKVSTPLTTHCFNLSPQGGIAFVLIKGVLKVYFKQQQYISQVNRQILNYPDRNGDGQSDDGEEDVEDSGNE